MSVLSSAAAVRQPESSVSRVAFHSSRECTLVLCLLLVVVTLAFYNPIIHNGFLNYDDDGYITENAHVRSGLSWATVKWAFSTFDQGNWHPLTWLSHALDCQLFGLNPVGHHYVSVLIHALNAVLLFLMLQSAIGFRWRSLVVATLFALHPINVEPVAWAAERKTTLSTFFFLLAFYAYVRYAQRPNFKRYWLVFVLFGLALLSKPQVITFPCLLLLWDFWPLHRADGPFPPAACGTEPQMAKTSIARLLLEKIPLLMLSAASAVVTIKAQKAGGAVKSLAQIGFPLRVETALVAYMRYLEKAVWPRNLVGFYPHATKLYPLWEVSAAAILLALITFWVMIDRKRRYLAVGWFWFLGSVFPVSGLFQVGFQEMADRFAYTSYIGLFLMATWWVADRFTQHTSNQQVSGQWLFVTTSCCCIIFGILTSRQITYWHDPETFWKRTLALTQNNFVAESNLGEFLFSQQRLDEAATHFRAALVMNPDSPSANLNLGAYEDRRGNPTAAIEHYQIVIHKGGDIGMQATAWGSMGFVYRQLGQTDKAKECFEASLRVDPGRARARVGLGLLAQDKADYEGAIRQYSEAVHIQPSQVTYLLLAKALDQDGHANEAKAIYEKLERSPDYAEVQNQAAFLIRP